MAPAHEPARWQEAAAAYSSRSLAAGDPTGWFDQLYAAADGGAVTMPWDRAEGHALLASWAAGRSLGDGARAVVTGCGLGADAEHLAGLGLRTTAFDVAPTAVRLARERFPGSAVDYVVADLLDLPASWAGAFDLVVEIFTLQALPPDLHETAGRAVAGLVADGGTLLCIGSTAGSTGAPPPWPLTRDELDGLAVDGLAMTAYEVVTVPGTDDRRQRVEYRRSAG